jgi:hypothetical protein
MKRDQGDFGDLIPPSSTPKLKDLAHSTPVHPRRWKPATPTMIQLNPGVGPVAIDKLNSLQINDLAYTDQRQKSSEKRL